MARRQSSPSDSDPQPTSPEPSDVSGASATAPQPAPSSAPESQPEPGGEQGGLFRDALLSQGFTADQLGDLDDETIVQNLVSGWRQSHSLAEQLQQAKPWLEMAQRYQPHAADIDKWLAERARAPVTPPEPEKPYWDPAPEWNPAWESAVAVYEDGPYKGQSYVRAPFDASVLSKIQAYRDWQRRGLEKLVSDPYAAIEPKVKAALDDFKKGLLEEWKTDYQKSQTERDAQNYILQFKKDNADWLVAKDPKTGQPIYDPQTGQPVPSPAGQAFGQALELLHKSYDPNDPVSVAHVAMRLAQSFMPQGAASPVPPQTTPQDRFVAQSPSRAGTLLDLGNSRTPPTNPDMDLRNMLLEAFRADGKIP